MVQLVATPLFRRGEWVGVGGCRGLVVGGRVREWQWQQVVGLYGPSCSHSSLWAGWVGGWVGGCEEGVEGWWVVE